MNLIERTYQYLTSEVHNPLALRIFTVLVYLWFPINAMFLFDVKDLLWGINNVFFRHGYPDGFIENFFYQLVYDATRFHFIFYLHLVASMLSVFSTRWAFVPRLITWATAWILYYSAIESFNSGMMIMIQLAFFSAIVYVKAKHPIGIMLTNLARMAVLIQLSLVYFVAAIYKVSGTQWLSGDAFYYTVHITHFASDFWTSERMLRLGWIGALITWAGLAYQLLFPVMIWLKRGRHLFLIAGIIFHLFIGTFLHLWDFALAMIFCYAIFIPEKTISKYWKLS
jgi:hypothetical protein